MLGLITPKNKLKTRSWSDAAQNALTEAAKTIKGITGVHVKRCTAKVRENKIVEYIVNLKIAFTIER